MQNKKNVILVAGFIVVALIAFYAGTAYSKSKSATPQNGNQASFGGQGGQFGQGRGMRAGGGNVFGQIITKDANSITVEIKTPTGPNNATTASTGTGSKIVFYTGTTTISKTTDGTIDDLTVGKNITVQGTANPDGSVNAQSISLRPAMPNQTKN